MYPVFGALWREREAAGLRGRRRVQKKPGDDAERFAEQRVGSHEENVVLRMHVRAAYISLNIQQLS